ncbi:hypothetical protein ABZ543_34470 [Streptomyces roseifaciens]
MRRVMAFIVGAVALLGVLAAPASAAPAPSAKLAPTCVINWKYQVDSPYSNLCGRVRRAAGPVDDTIDNIGNAIVG